MILWEGNFTEFVFKFNMVFHLFDIKKYFRSRFTSYGVFPF